MQYWTPGSHSDGHLRDMGWENVKHDIQKTLVTRCTVGQWLFTLVIAWLTWSWVYEIVLYHKMLASAKIQNLAGVVLHAYNLSYSGGREGENCSLRAAQAKKLSGPHLNK
jgi:hypothetical protein